jgi:site-specific DNA-methyltransferase (adenine-specific)
MSSRLPKPYSQFQIRRAVFRFYLGDCLDVLRSMTPGTISVIVTSPPYNLGVRYRSYDDTLPRDRYLSWTGEWIAAAAQALDPARSLFLNVGHYKPINSDRFVNDCHEFIFHFSPSGRTPLDRLAVGVTYQDASNVARWRGAARNLRCRGNTWFIPYETIQDRDKDRPHPATFPPRIPEYCLRLHGVSRVQTALDPFLGLGNTAIAAATVGVDFIGIEIDQHYLQEAISRVKAGLR